MDIAEYGELELTRPPATEQLSERIGLAVRNIGIPPRPAILDEIDREMRKDDPDFKRMANIIGSDVGLAASVIKVANSPGLGMGKPVRTIPDALLVLGLKLTVHTIATIVLQRIFPHVPSLERFWDSAARCARVSRWLVLQQRRYWQVNPDDAYTFGLFRDCGIPVLLIPFPSYVNVLMQANQDKIQLFTATENAALGLNHADVGAQLASEWRLPEELVLAICYHHDAGLYKPDGGDLVRRRAALLAGIALTADYLIQQTTGFSQDCEWEKLGADVQTFLGLVPERLAQLLADGTEIVTGNL
jgi:HD-like signal output (HDOD) protein